MKSPGIIGKFLRVYIYREQFEDICLSITYVILLCSVTLPNSNIQQCAQEGAADDVFFFSLKDFPEKSVPLKKGSGHIELVFCWKQKLNSQNSIK